MMGKIALDIDVMTVPDFRKSFPQLKIEDFKIV